LNFSDGKKFSIYLQFAYITYFVTTQILIASNMRLEVRERLSKIKDYKFEVMEFQQKVLEWHSGSSQLKLTTDLQADYS